MCRAETEILLSSKNINFDVWGQGESKTLQHLLDELTSGESTLEIDGSDRVVRKVEGSAINIYYSLYQGKTLILVEEKQVFTGGRVRIRNINTSIGEKMRPSESPMEAGIRAMQEELKISDITLAPIGTEHRDLVASTSFPGLWTKNTIHVFETYLNSQQFRPEGYMEIQEDKTTYFMWVEI